jgi:hypothetical protein
MKLARPKQESLAGKYGKKGLVREVQMPFNAIMRKEYGYERAFAWEALLMSPSGLDRVERILTRGREEA